MLDTDSRFTQEAHRPERRGVLRAAARLGVRRRLPRPRCRAALPTPASAPLGAFLALGGPTLGEPGRPAAEQSLGYRGLPGSEPRAPTRSPRASHLVT